MKFDELESKSTLNKDSVSIDISSKVNKKSSEIWSVADILRGTFRPAEYIRTILPFLVLRRFDCVMEESGTHIDVIEAYQVAKDDYTDLENLDIYLKRISKLNYYNTGEFTLSTLLSDPDNLKVNLALYIDAYSPNVKSIISNFNFKEIIEKLEKFGLLFSIVEKFSIMNLLPYSENNTDGLTNIEMGYIFEDLLRRFSEMTNETAGEHYTPRSIVRLCAELAIGLDKDLAPEEAFKSIYDPTCGTGGMLTVGEETLKTKYPNLDVKLYGQELNPESFAVAQADLLIKGHDSNGLKLGNTLTNDMHYKRQFNYVIANPPYGVSWKHEENFVKKEAGLGIKGRFAAGTPSVSDGSLLFVQHMISKLDPKGGRVAVVLNGSPLTNGDAGSGESNIRKWILDNDLLVAIIALPSDMFYNTGIKTYIWLLDNNKDDRRKGKVQFIDASAQFYKMKKALGSKRNDMNESQIEWVKSIYIDFDKADKEFSKVLQNEELLFRKVTVDVPLLDEDGKLTKDKKGYIVVDKSQRDSEKIPFLEDVNEYMKREVLPHVENAIWDEGKIGAEFPIDQFFYKYEPLPSTDDIKVELDKSVKKIQNLFKEFLGNEFI